MGELFNFNFFPPKIDEVYLMQQRIEGKVVFWQNEKSFCIKEGTSETNKRNSIRHYTASHYS